MFEWKIISTTIDQGKVSFNGYVIFLRTLQSIGWSQTQNVIQSPLMAQKSEPALTFQKFHQNRYSNQLFLIYYRAVEWSLLTNQTVSSSPVTHVLNNVKFI